MAKPTFVTNDVPTAAQINQWMVNIQAAYKTSDEGLASTTTLQDDNDLQIAVEANGVYEVFGLLVVTGGGGDIKIAWSAPAGATFDWVGHGLDPASVAYNGDQLFSGEVSSQPTFGTIAGATRSSLAIQGLLVVSSTAGTFKSQWTQGTSSASTTTMRAGSYLRLFRIS